MANSAYPFEPGYGSGLPERIGDVLEPLAVRADVFAQLLQEDSVAPSPVPQVAVAPIAGGGATIGIVYADRSGTLRNLSFDLG